MKLFGGIEAGGTKFICAVGDSTGKLNEKIRIPTTTPNETMSEVFAFFKKVMKKTPLLSIGVSSFGPLNLNVNSRFYGYITTAPKSGWGMFNFVGTLKEEFDIPIGFDTDVNGAAIGECRWGRGKGLEDLVYCTVGTGIGVGGILSGKVMHGLTHPEMGHIFVPHDKKKDPFEGICPFHRDCLEGLAAGPAIEKRFEKSSFDLPKEHQYWDLEAEYIGYAMVNCIFSLSPKRIVLGGGVMQKDGLLGKIREKTLQFLAGYVKDATILDIDNFIVSPGLKEDSGVLGAIALAELAYERK